MKKFGWSTGPSGVKRHDLVQEIRYDALGRRIFQHTRRKPLCQNPCYEAFERYVWDGDQLLYELRSSSGSAQYSTGKQYGRTGYVHGPGIDAPLAIMRQNFESSAAIRINPFANWRGQYERGNASGGWPLCTGSNGPSCISVAWPAPQARTFLDGVPAEAGDWVGSLIKDQRDASGLLYRRNRYYDPSTGQFTQEDPIGVAGGFNLYGFAGGDPVNAGDPFGLCPPELTGRPCTGLHAFGTAVGASVGGVLGGAGGAVAGTVVLPVAGTIGGGAAGVAAGAAEGAIVGLAVANVADMASVAGAAAVERLRVNWKDLIGQLGLALGLEILQKPKPPEPEPPKQENIGPPPPKPEKPDWLKIDK